MNKKFFNFLYVILIISLLCFMLWMVMWLKSTSKDCVADPLNYYADHHDTDKCNLNSFHYEISCVPNDLNNGEINFFPISTS